MPSFLRDLKRRSKSFRSTKGAAQESLKESSSITGKNGHSNGSGALNPRLPHTQSTSTLNSAYLDGSNTPPSTVPSEGSASNLKTYSSGNGAPPPVPTRPNLANNKRYSIASSVVTSPTGNDRSFIASSPYAPRVLSISNNSWVNQKVLLISGQIGDVNLKSIDGSVIVNHHNDAIPPTSWQACDSHFKALVYLQPGPNRIRLDFFSPKISSGSHTSLPTHHSWININLLPLTSSPPLHLAIILGKDSPGVFDAVPERVAKEGNGLDTAVRKYRMAAYLWQAFTGEQMNRNGFGRRCFRFEEEWQTGTLSYHDFEANIMRSEAKVHIIRSEKTVQEIQDMEVAQQNPKASRSGDLFGIASEAIKSHFEFLPGQTRYVAAMFLDSHWDTNTQTVRGHAALGGGDGSLQLAIFGSQALQSYPSCLEEVGAAFSDCTKTDTSHVANDCGESGSNWEAANIGIGAHMHEVGHLFGCPHQESGVMLRDYTRLNRTFTCREPFSTRTNSKGQICLQADECAWHRLDCLRFRFHPAFRHETDQPLNGDPSVQVWTADNASVVVVAPTGITFIELYTEGEDVCQTYIDYVDMRINGGMSKDGLPRQITLTDTELRAKLPEQHKKKKLKLGIHSAGQGKHIIEDFNQLADPKSAKVKLSNGRKGFRGGKLGFSQMEGSHPEEIILDSALKQTKLMTSIRVYHGFAVDGIEFFYEDGQSQLFGKRSGKPGGSEFVLDVRRGEHLTGFYLRAGLWIDGIQILTSLGRKSDIFGNPTGGSGHLLLPPRSYTVVGISGSCAQWLDGFQLIIAR